MIASMRFTVKATAPPVRTAQNMPSAIGFARTRRPPARPKSRPTTNASQPSATWTIGSNSCDHRALDEAERVRPDGEAEADELDARRKAAGRAAADDEAPHVREEQEAHQERDRAHVSSGLAVAPSVLRARAAPRPSPTPSFASASWTAFASDTSWRIEALVMRQCAPVPSR